MQNELILASRKELSWGLRYLLFQQVFLVSFLRPAAQVLGIPLTPAALNIVFFSVNFLAVILICRKFLAASLGYGLQHPVRCLLSAAVGFGLYQLLMWLLGLVIVAIAPEFANVNDQSIASISQENYPLMALGTVLLVPLAEETLHRGVVFGIFYRRSRVAAYLVSTVFFSLIHIMGFLGSAEPLILFLCFVQYLPAGLCLAAAYEISGSLLAPILIHTAVNAIGMMAVR